MRVAIGQLNPTVGDLDGNRRLAEEAAAKAAADGATLLLLPELVLTGYPPMDLLERDGFIADQLEALDALAAASRGIDLVVGAVIPRSADSAGVKRHENAAVLLSQGRRVATRGKTLLPSYDVFDEKRYFAPARKREPVSIADALVGLTVCEDVWVDEMPYSIDPVAELVAAGAECVLNLSCSPWRHGKPLHRRETVCRLAQRHGVPIVYANQLGGNDEIIFDGGSFVAGADGRILAQLPLFEPALQVIDLEQAGPGVAPDAVEEPSRTAQLESALVLGIRDYFRKQGLPPGAVIGLSGGIDSAVTAHLAVEALGAERVLGVAMPGPFSSEHSVSDAVAVAENLGIELRTIEIAPMYEAYRGAFAQLFGEQDDYGLTQQNIQSRIRGALLMAVSNAEGRLVLATGNKSELSIGYCTLYGDTVGGLCVLGDVYKHDVYALARHANRDAPRIPESTIDKPPSAELAPDQLDSDDLPPYDVLDAVLAQAVEGALGADAITPPPGADRETVRRIVARLDRNEYKRRQSPLVLRVSEKAFGSGRRLPIVHRYSGA
ncbi:MAG: NAD+ synthase [Myxococcales bacterium]|nr:NAD+ synthase [Myxococcales bacterium]